LQRSEGLDTVDANLRLGFDADLREYDMAAHMLRDLGVRSVRMLTNNPAKIAGIERFGTVVTDRVPIAVKAHSGNRDYLITKRDRLGHILDHVDLDRTAAETGEFEVAGAR
jgi:3,4-dihydroxy 2-butanone 4-phosphate synthase/GTP cyclohydrolase II